MNRSAAVCAALIALEFDAAAAQSGRLTETLLVCRGSVEATSRIFREGKPSEASQPFVYEQEILMALRGLDLIEISTNGSQRAIQGCNVSQYTISCSSEKEFSTHLSSLTLTINRVSGKISRRSTSRAERLADDPGAVLVQNSTFDGVCQFKSAASF